MQWWTFGQHCHEPERCHTCVLVQFLDQLSDPRIGLLCDVSAVACSRRPVAYLILLFGVSVISRLLAGAHGQMKGDCYETYFAG
jgi:hypothetical protein